MIKAIKSSPQVLWHISNYATHWWGGLQIALPTQSKIHLAFHVSHLKKAVGQKCHIEMKLREMDEEGSICLLPKAILETKERQLRQKNYLWHFDLVERYCPKRFYLVTIKDSTMFSLSPTLRIMPLLKGEVMLVPNLTSLIYIYTRP